MKKHRKLVALLIALTFLFSVAAPAMAASDVSAAEKAAGKLEALGIIEGYPDGTFGLDREITRAEFAKVAVIASGHGDAGEILKATPSKFSDVKTNEWYTGWINLAASQGYVKGYPDGTFRPNDKITNAEVVTVLLRLLGYNDNLPGDWPTNYIVKAVALEITKGISFDAKGFAVRGEVFMMADKALDTEMVKWVSDDQAFEGKNEKLIAKSFEGQMEDGLITDITWDSKGYMSADIDGSSIEVSEDVIVTGGPDLLALLGSKVDYVLNDDDEIVYASVKDTKTVSKDKATIGSKKINIDKKDYDLAEDFGVTFFPGSGDYEEGKEIKADNIVVVLDKKNNAEWAFVYDYNGGDIFDEIDGNYIVLENSSYNLKDKEFVVVKNGAIGSLDDLASGDLVYVIKEKSRLDYLIIASDETVEGTLENIDGDKKKVTVDGTAYDLKYVGSDIDTWISDNGGKDYDQDSSLLGKDMVDEAVVLVLSPTGKAGILVSEVEAADDIFVLFLNGTDKAWTDFGKKEIEVLNASGKKVIYTVAKKEAWNNIRKFDADEKEDIGFSAEKGNLLQIELNKDGEIKAITKAEGAEGYEDTLIYVYEKDSDTNRIQLADTAKGADEAPGKTKWFRADETVFFVLDAEGDWSTAKWSTVKGSAVIGNAEQATVITDGNKIKYLVMEVKAADTDKYGVVVDKKISGKGEYVKLAIKAGEVADYDVDTVYGGFDNLGKGDYVKYDVLSDGKIDITDVVKKSDLKAEAVKVIRATSDEIKLEGDMYIDRDEDTTIVDLTNSPKVVSSLFRGDYVTYRLGDKGIATFILIFEEEGTGAPTDITFTIGDSSNAVLAPASAGASWGRSVTVTVYAEDLTGWDGSLPADGEVSVDLDLISASGVKARSVSTPTIVGNTITFTMVFSNDIWAGDKLDVKAGAVKVTKNKVTGAVKAGTIDINLLP